MVSHLHLVLTQRREGKERCEKVRKRGQSTSFFPPVPLPTRPFPFPLMRTSACALRRPTRSSLLTPLHAALVLYYALLFRWAILPSPRSGNSLLILDHLTVRCGWGSGSPLLALVRGRRTRVRHKVLHDGARRERIPCPLVHTRTRVGIGTLVVFQTTSSGSGRRWDDTGPLAESDSITVIVQKLELMINSWQPCDGKK
jgi:hypothetical protein